MRHFFILVFIIFFSSVGWAQTSVLVSAGEQGGVVEHRYEGDIITYAPIIESTDAFSSISYAWKAIVDGSENDLGNNSQLTYTIPTIGTAAGKLVDIAVAINAEPKDTLILPIDTTIHYSLYVYAQPILTQNSYYTDLYVGGENITLSFIHEGGKDGAWSYAWDTDAGNTNAYTFKPTSTGEYQIKVLVTNTLGNADAQYDFSKILTYTIRVWDACSVEQDSYYQAMYVGDEMALSFVHNGGKDGAWTYEWDNNVSAASVYTFKPTSAGDYQIKVLVKNTLGNSDSKYDYSKTLTYSIKVWEKCNVVVDGMQDGYNYFENQEYTHTIKVSGGDNTKWAYEWYVNDQKKSTTSTCVVNAPDVENVEYEVVKLMIKATNTPDNIYKPFSYQKTYTFKVWARDVKVAKPTIRRIYYHDSIATLALEYAGGCPDAWKFKWFNPDGTNQTTSDSLFHIKLRNTSDSKQVQTYRVEWKNALGNIDTTGVDTFNLDVYPQIKIPSLVNTTGVIRTRDIDQLVLSANSGRGGNPDGWFYAWDNELYSMDISYVFSANIDLNIKDTIQRQVPLRWVNVGIEGDTIARGVLSQPIVVYNTPATPILKVKGNGTSNIYIVDDMGMTETELWANGYSFRFWDGNTMMAEIDNQRWYRYNNVPNDAWVQSIWYYDDGFVCEGEIAKPAVVNEIVSSKTTVSVYRIDGELIMKRTLDEDDSIDNMSEGLETGLYIIRYENNGTSDTYKVVIK